MLYLVTLHVCNDLSYEDSWDRDEVVGVFDSTESAEAVIMDQYTKEANKANDYKYRGFTLSKSIEKIICDDGEIIFEFETEQYMETITHTYSIQSIDINQVLNATESEEE